MSTEHKIYHNKMIAVVDDERDIVQLVELHLKKNGFAVQTFQRSKPFLEYIEKNTVDLIVLDIMLPDDNGLEICRMLRSKDQFKNIPIIFLTARVDEIDKIIGFELGCDDYITKPFSPRELIARIKAVLKRSVKISDNKIAIADDLSIDHERHEVLVNGSLIELTATEFKILSLLASHKGNVFSRDQILDHVWKHEKYVVDRTVDVHIRHLRKKLGDAAKYIKNIRGVGYKLSV